MIGRVIELAYAVPVVSPPSAVPWPIGVVEVISETGLITYLR